MKNFFNLFDFPISYHINESELMDRYFEKQKQLNSEKNHSESDYNNSVAYLNEAYKTLINPVNRAEYIIKLRELQIDNICCGSADEMFEIHEKYDLLSSEDEKKKFQVFLRQRISKIIESLYELSEYSSEFYYSTCLLLFIHSFLEKTGFNVYSRN